MQNKDNKCLPKWSFSSQLDPHSKDFARQIAKVKSFSDLAKINSLEKDALTKNLLSFDRAASLLASLKAATKCKLAQDIQDLISRRVYDKLLLLEVSLREIKTRLFEAILACKEISFDEDPFKDYHYQIELESKSVFAKIPKEKQDTFALLKTSVVLPAARIFDELNALLPSISHSTTLVKGAGSPHEREQNQDFLNSFYKKHDKLYASVLASIHGYNLARIKAAKCDLLTPALEQNHISKQAFDAMQAAIFKHKLALQESVSLRAKAFNKDTLSIHELNAPTPTPKGFEGLKPSFDEAISLIKESFAKVDPSMSDFVSFMLTNKQIEASQLASKKGGAFCENMHYYSTQMTFSTYSKSTSWLFTQAHELGHAYQYFLLNKAAFAHCLLPMSLAECASNFAEFVLRRHLQNMGDKNMRFLLLWQELKSISTNLLHIPARFSFELAYLQALQGGFVSANEACALMRRAWEEHYGSTTQGADEYLWCFKLHFYKIDSYLYNFPYTIGYLLSLILGTKYIQEGKAFFPALKGFLQECGQMSVDKLVHKHFGLDATREDFWEIGISQALGMMDEFKKEFC